MLLTKKYTDLVDALKKSNPSLVIYDPTPLLCDLENDALISMVVLVYSFADHISDYSGDKISKELLPIVHSLQK